MPTAHHPPCHKEELTFEIKAVSAELSRVYAGAESSITIHEHFCDHR